MEEIPSYISERKNLMAGKEQGTASFLQLYPFYLLIFNYLNLFQPFMQMFKFTEMQLNPVLLPWRVAKSRTQLSDFHFTSLKTSVKCELNFKIRV